MKEDLEKIIVLKTELDDIVAKNGLDLNDVEVLDSGILVDVKFETESIEAEDDAREVFNLDTATNYVKLSAFEVRPVEDFSIVNEKWPSSELKTWSKVAV